MSELQIIKNADSYNLDTRERLERCLRVLLGLRIDEEPDPTISGIYYNILGLLDRQAAITTAYCTAQIKDIEAERDQLSRDLKAEHALLLQFEDDNERLREALNAFDLNQFYSLYRAKCEECEQIKKVVRTQADSFKKLEIELAGKDG